MPSPESSALPWPGTGEDGQGVDGFTYAAVDGRDSDAEPGGRLGVGVTAPQVGQSEQCLSRGEKTSPPRPDVLPSGRQSSGREPQSAAGQINRGWVDKHAQLLADTDDLG
jgi:hypothetical protein